jgi:hypothetical protein
MCAVTAATDGKAGIVLGLQKGRKRTESEGQGEEDGE